MKKAILYIVLFFSGIVIGSLVLNKDYFKIKPEPKKSEYVASLKPIEDNREEFKQSAYSMLGNSIIVKGQIMEVYKNQYNESVVYLKDYNIPLTVTCAIFNSEVQIKEAFRIGEEISLQGKFTELGDEMHLDNCRILMRSERER
jgi:RecG-like helicase